MSSVHSLYNLKLSRIWNKFLKTAHKIKELVQRETGNRPVKEATREGFWTTCGDKDANPFKFWFSWPGGTHVQTGAGQEVSALQNAVASTVPAAGTHSPSPKRAAYPRVRVEATPHHLMEKRQAGPSSPAFHTSKIFSPEWPQQRWSGGRREISWLITPLK